MPTPATSATDNTAPAKLTSRPTRTAPGIAPALEVGDGIRPECGG